VAKKYYHDRWRHLVGMSPDKLIAMARQRAEELGVASVLIQPTRLVSGAPEPRADAIGRARDLHCASARISGGLYYLRSYCSALQHISVRPPTRTRVGKIPICLTLLLDTALVGKGASGQQNGAMANRTPMAATGIS
jgi:hypothetical protein